MKTSVSNLFCNLGRHFIPMLFFLLLGLVHARAQNLVSGVVSDEEGIPLAGVTVVTEYDGRRTGVITDEAGRYELKCNPGGVNWNSAASVSSPNV